jgi:hypothetical protein
MKRILGLFTVMALVLFAVPAIAQQDYSTDKQGVSSDQGAQPATPSDQSISPQKPEGSRQAGDVTEPSKTGVTQPTSESATREANPTDTGNAASQTGATNEEGGAMPTTASPLPLVLSLGFMLVMIGTILRFASGRR